MTKVPVTPEVLAWAIRESGYSADELAQAADTTTQELRLWLRGVDLPTLSQAKALAQKLRRPLAALLLPAEPRIAGSPIQYRHPRNSARKKLTPEEQHAIRHATSLQQLIAWTRQETGEVPRALLTFSVDSEAETAAERARKVFRPTSESEPDPTTPTEAFARYRQRLEAAGILVLLVHLSDRSIRGFSLWTEEAPLIAVSTGFNVQARIFTLFHELGHLLTRTSSACASLTLRLPDLDRIERWCEEFAAAYLLPTESIRRAAPKDSAEPVDLAMAGRIARNNHVSLRASVLRLVKMGLAKKELYGAIPRESDYKASGGGGGQGRPRTEIRKAELGMGMVRAIVGAADAGVITRADAMNHLGVSDLEVDVLAGRASE